MADEYIGKENAIDVAKKYLGTIGLNPEILVDSFITMPPADVVPYSISDDGTMTVTVPKGMAVGRVFVQRR